jgi:hypothetical protein
MEAKGSRHRFYGDVQRMQTVASLIQNAVPTGSVLE